jgi:hypothetical protein
MHAAMFRPPFPCFNVPNNICWKVHIIELFIMELSSSSFFVQMFSSVPFLCAFLYVFPWDEIPSFMTKKNNGEIYLKNASDILKSSWISLRHSRLFLRPGCAAKFQSSLIYLRICVQLSIFCLSASWMDRSCECKGKAATMSSLCAGYEFADMHQHTASSRCIET